MGDLSKNMARKQDELPTPSSTPPGEMNIKDFMENMTQDQMFKTLLDQMTIIDEDAKDRRKQIVVSLLTQLAALTKSKLELEVKLKNNEEMNKVLAKKLGEIRKVEPTKTET